MDTEEQWLAFVDDCASKLLNGGLDKDTLAKGAIRFDHYARTRSFSVTLLARCQNIDPRRTLRTQVRADIATASEIFRNALP